MRSPSAIGVYLFVIFGLICGTVAIKFFPQNARSDIEFNTMSERLGHKVRYAAWQVSDEILDLVVLADTGKGLDHTIIVPQNLEVAVSELDTLVLFLDGWEDINNFPWAARLGLSYEGYLEVDELAISVNEQPFLIEQRTLAIAGLTEHFQILSVNTQRMGSFDDRCLGIFLYDIISKPYWGPSRSEPTKLSKYYNCEGDTHG